MKWSIMYLLSILVAQYTAEWFVPFLFVGMLSFGTLTFGITFTARDKVHYLGRRHVYLMIFISAIASFVLSYLGDIPGRIIIASVVAILLAEVADTEIYQIMIKRSWIVRVASSNAISVPIDTGLFTTIAFYGIFPILPIIYADIIVKYIIGFLLGLTLARKHNEPKTT